MTASPPSNTKTTKNNWLPWVIGIAIVVLLAWWMRGCGKVPEAGVVTDTTQSMMAPDTTPAPAPEATPAPAPAQTATPAPATPTAIPRDTAQAMKPRTSTPSRADTIRAPAAALPPAETTGPGAMGGRGEPGKKPPATTP